MYIPDEHFFWSNSVRKRDDFITDVGMKTYRNLYKLFTLQEILTL